ncbi:hypothetical protein, partial [Streptomyces sp. S3(2020)]|uniref:hypothetical protein n=1 Tax=Streptomyces sp. S3(2020) TaxID=2732044 RepID=UPI0019D2031D
GGGGGRVVGADAVEAADTGQLSFPHPEHESRARTGVGPGSSCAASARPLRRTLWRAWRAP